MTSLSESLSRGHAVEVYAAFAQGHWLLRFGTGLFLPLVHDLCPDLFYVVDAPLLGFLLRNFLFFLSLLLC